MLVKDLPANADLTTIKIRIPNEYKKETLAVGLRKMDVYFASSWFSGVWVKTSPKLERIYPLSGIFSSTVLEWEVVDE